MSDSKLVISFSDEDVHALLEGSLRAMKSQQAKTELAKWDACVKAFRQWCGTAMQAPTPEGSAYIDTLLALPIDWQSPTLVGCGW